MNKFLLDTDIFSEVKKGINRNVVQKARLYELYHEKFTISIFTVSEVLKGFQKIKNSMKIKNFIEKEILELEVLDFTLEASKISGLILADLERTGSSIGVFDVLIASIAISNSLPLATGNTDHYQKIKNLGYPIVLENWKL